MTVSEELIQRRRAVISDGLGMVTPLTAASGKNSILIDLDGREIIDFASGIGVTSAGHCPDRVVAAIENQARQLIHTCVMVATYEPYVALAEDLVALFPHGERTKVMLTTTGAESVENAIKIARQATRRSGVLCYTGAFHGRTMMGMALTSKVAYKRWCGPFPGGVYRLPYPDYYHQGDGLSQDAFVSRELRRVEDAFQTMVPADEVAAIIIEPILGEGGFVAAPAAYLQGLRRICDQHGIMLILDEVQTGFCRTGRWACYEYAGVTPDISTWAKAMGSGMPIGAVMGRAGIMDKAQPGTIGGTYPGNPVTCAAARATIQVMKDQDLCGRATHIGNLIGERFAAFQEQYPRVVGDVRGMGAMRAMELVQDGDPHRPDPARCRRILETCWEKGLLVIPAGTYKNVIRLLVPLTIEDATLKRGMDILSHALDQSFQSE
ncbi:aspartate aminotransferase family protein [Acanthopleuribacter pedis]|uniref:Aspartate aminotransferase family protein n=1 Tax=Acanthopleuribacter pedis TaxID=442870 RepID=A0A8J7U468_9BACT|nr:aspartate aminotransferase family protein [Acanthopleuribacter pedis]MBO1319514.1 aspartate aminotransferase family protein [Acanthopleuribacter pedis]